MKESVTYQAIVEEGEVKEIQDAILKIGSKRFGPPGEADKAKLRGVTDVEQLRHLLDRALEAETWEDLFARIG